MEKLKDKLLKIRNLTGSKEPNEAAAAQKKFEELTTKYGITTDEFDDPQPKLYQAKYKNNLHLRLLLMSAIQVIGTERAKTASYFCPQKIMYLKVTGYEYTEICAMADWHFRNYKKEQKSFLRQFDIAYTYKHFDIQSDSESSTPNNLTQAEIKEIVGAIKLSKELTNTYHKQVEE